jgi:peptide deformylase
MLQIATYPQPVLRQTAKQITEFNQELRDLATAMGRAMYEDDGIGLAAPQVSVSQRLIVIGDADKKSFAVYVNPEITFFSREKSVNEEGCLSLPKIYGLVKRPKKIHLKYQDLDGKVNKVKIKDFTAIVLQHEIDHLNGILFIDRAEKITEGQDLLDKLKAKV